MFRLLETKFLSQCLGRSFSFSGAEPAEETSAPLGSGVLICISYMKGSKVWVGDELTLRNTGLEIIGTLVSYGKIEGKGRDIPFPVKTVMKTSSCSAISLIYFARR
jgi:hypothetical protein